VTRLPIVALALLAFVGLGQAVDGALNPAAGPELSYVTAAGEELYTVPTPGAVPPAEEWTDHGLCDPCTWWRELNPATHLWTLHRGPRAAMPDGAWEVDR
jgi:hypothetical protein